jgi:hypothetical protein
MRPKHWTDKRCPKCNWKLHLFTPIRGNTYYTCPNKKCDWTDPKSGQEVVKVGEITEIKNLLKDALSILKDLASNPPVSYDDYSCGYAYQCELCSAVGDDPSEVKHEESCPYRRAVEFMKSQI